MDNIESILPLIQAGVLGFVIGAIATAKQLPGFSIPIHPVQPVERHWIVDTKLHKGAWCVKSVGIMARCATEPTENGICRCE